jgi:hypothetical protein
VASTLELLNAATLSFWANKPTASLYVSGGFSVPNNALTPIQWNAEQDDNWSSHSTSVNTSRFTAQVAGIYRFSGAFAVPTSATGYRLGAWFYNGAEYNSNSRIYVTPSTASINSVPMPSTKIRMAVGDYVEFAAFQNSGGALTTTDGTWLDAEFVHF